MFEKSPSLQPELPSPEQLVQEVITKQLNDFSFRKLTKQDVESGTDKDGKPLLAPGESLEKRIEHMLQLRESLASEAWGNFILRAPMPLEDIDVYKSLPPSSQLSEIEEWALRIQGLELEDTEAHNLLESLHTQALPAIRAFNTLLLEAAKDTDEYDENRDDDYFDPAFIHLLNTDNLDNAPLFSWRGTNYVFSVKLNKEQYDHLLKPQHPDNEDITLGKAIAMFIMAGMASSDFIVRVTSSKKNQELMSKLFTDTSFRPLLKLLFAQRMVETQKEKTNQVEQFFRSVGDRKSEALSEKAKSMNTKYHKAFFDLVIGELKTKKFEHLTLHKMFVDNPDTAVMMQKGEPQHLNPEDPTSLENRIGTESSVVDFQFSYDATLQALSLTLPKSSWQTIENEAGRKSREKVIEPVHIYVKTSETEVLFGEEQNGEIVWSTQIPEGVVELYSLITHFLSPFNEYLMMEHPDVNYDDELNKSVQVNTLSDFLRSFNEKALNHEHSSRFLFASVHPILQFGVFHDPKRSSHAPLN